MATKHLWIVHVIFSEDFNLFPPNNALGRHPSLLPSVCDGLHSCMAKCLYRPGTVQQFDCLQLTIMFEPARLLPCSHSSLPEIFGVRKPIAHVLEGVSALPRAMFLISSINRVQTSHTATVAWNSFQNFAMLAGKCFASALVLHHMRVKILLQGVAV